MACKSWADVVKNTQSDSSAKIDSFKPAKKGERKVLSHGKVVVMLGRYGWIEPCERIDHPASSRHQGHIYVSTKDVRKGTMLIPDTFVSFYLYIDEDGFGAEDVHRTEGELESKHFQALPRWQGTSGLWNSSPVPSGAASTSPRMVLMKTESVERWMSGLAARHVTWQVGPDITTHTSAPTCNLKASERVDNEQNFDSIALLSEASTSAGESSDSDGCSFAMQPWRRTKARARAAFVAPPPGLEDVCVSACQAVPTPPGLQLQLGLG